MQCPATWVCTLSLALMGCPEMHRPGGLIDRAAHKDALENIPEQCTPQERRMYCEGGKEHSAACREKCGEAE